MSDSFKIERSKMVDTSPDVQKALEHVLGVLRTRAENVVSVQVLSNFSIDHEANLQHGQQYITTGLVVCVNKEFALCPDDVVWFHPSIGQGRSIFSLTQAIPKATLEAVTQRQTVDQETSENTAFISDTGCNFGEYVISKPDEFGCQQEEHYLVVDTNANALLAPLHTQWLNSGTTAGEISTQWKRMCFNDVYSVPDKTRDMRAKIAETVAPSAKMTYDDTTNTVLTNAKDVFFVNNAVKVGQSKSVMVHSSSLGGYRLYNAIDEDVVFFPASLGTDQSFYDWNSLTPQNCSRIENTCLWSGALTFNTQVMRPPSLKSTNLREMENEYGLSLKDTLGMAMARFSASDSIQDQLSPQELFQLTPTSKHVSKTHKYIDTPLSMGHQVTQKLMHNLQAVEQAFPQFALFNPNIVKKGRLHLPRKIFEFLLK
jgi:hypothetical protein